MHTERGEGVLRREYCNGLFPKDLDLLQKKLGSSREKVSSQLEDAEGVWVLRPGLCQDPES